MGDIFQKGAMALVEDPLSLLLLYRYPRNDPINAKFNPFHTAADPQQMIQLQQGLIKTHLQNAHPYSFDYPLTDKPKQQALLQMVSQSNFAQVVHQMHHLSSLSGPSALQTQFLPITWSSLTSPLGKFVSLSLNEENRVEIHSIEAGSANQVPRDVFQSVLNGAHLALNIQHGTIDAFYFVKDNIYKASNDIKTLRRLGPSVNLTSHDSQNSDGSVVMDVKVHLENTVISVRYGGDVESEKVRILRHASKVTVRRAWQRQKELLNSEITAEPRWTNGQREQLSLQGSVNDYDVHFRRHLQDYPELAADLANVIFVPKP